VSFVRTNSSAGTAAAAHVAAERVAIGAAAAMNGLATGGGLLIRRIQLY